MKNKFALSAGLAALALAGNASAAIDTTAITAAITEGQVAGKRCSDVHTNYGEVAIFEFQNVGAALAR